MTRKLDLHIFSLISIFEKRPQINFSPQNFYVENSFKNLQVKWKWCAVEPQKSILYSRILERVQESLKILFLIWHLESSQKQIGIPTSTLWKKGIEFFFFSFLHWEKQNAVSHYEKYICDIFFKNETSEDISTQLFKS